MNENRTYFGGVCPGVQQFGLPHCRMIAPEQGLACAPTAAGDQLSAPVLENKISPILDKLRVDGKYRLERALALCGCVIAGLQLSN